MSLSSHSSASAFSDFHKRNLKSAPGGNTKSDKKNKYNGPSSVSTKYFPDENMEFNIRLERLRGSRRSICQTENEVKANKLNRTEECVLESTKTRVRRESSLFEREYKQSMHQFRVRSARMFKDKVLPPTETDNFRRPRFDRSISVIESYKRPNIRLLNRRLNSEPSGLTKCHTCEKVQGVVDQYEDELYKNLDIEEQTHHTVCLFTDRQINTFMHILETEYSSKLPNASEFLQNSKTLFLTGQNPSTGKSKQQTPKTLRQNIIQQRIKDFCRRQDEFNKQHPIPLSIKQNADDVRMAYPTGMGQKKMLLTPNDAKV